MAAPAAPRNGPHARGPARLVAFRAHARVLLLPWAGRPLSPKGSGQVGGGQVGQRGDEDGTSRGFPGIANDGAVEGDFARLARRRGLAEAQVDDGAALTHAGRDDEVGRRTVEG